MSDMDHEVRSARMLGCEISTNPLDPLEPILKMCEYHHPDEDMSILARAYRRAVTQHSSQRRKSGEPYIIHPLAVAQILADLGMGPLVVAAGLLHDTVEDTDYTLDECRAEFGDTVTGLVDGVTKLSKMEYGDSAQAETIRKMVVAMSRDVRVLVVKLADRVHNARTWRYVKQSNAQKKARETLDVYAPLANRLGMNAIKTELEELSFKVLYPKIYNEIVVLVARRAGQRDVYLKQILAEINEDLDEQHIKAYVTGRPKDYFSIYQKMIVRGHDFANIYDLVGVRIIVDTIQDCYAALGAVHARWNPVPGRFKDYIAMPKLNMYQSLHTTVIGQQGIPFEVQIRTWEMHETAEYGIAAHWKYKQGVAGGDEKQFEWVRRLLETQQDSDAEDYIHSLKVDMFDDEVFVFTPKGKVMSLPSGSTPIDFAYAIHSGVGNAMVGAKVNNRIASYDQQLCNGDIVEVLTSKTAKGPSRDWLNICKSNGARTKIKQWFKKEKREENIVHGKASFEGEMRRANVNPAVLQDAELLPGLLKKLAFECLDDMYAAIGYGGLTAAKAFGRIRDDLIRATRQTPAPPVREVQKQAEPGKGGRHKDSGVIVEDIDSCMIKFSRCCTPVPGDDIVGFITKGYGVSIHRRDCRNASGASDPKQAGRWVKVAWSTEDKPFSTTFEIDSTDRSGIWLDIATALSAAKLKVTELSGRDMPTGKARTVATFEVRNVQELETIRTKIRAIDGVIDVRRGQN